MTFFADVVPELVCKVLAYGSDQQIWFVLLFALQQAPFQYFQAGNTPVIAAKSSKLQDFVRQFA